MISTYNLKKSGIIVLSVALWLSPGIQSCTQGSKEDHVIEIVTENMDFRGPSEVTSGWNTFHYLNRSSETHFFLLDKLPEGKIMQDERSEIFPVFQTGMDFLNHGNPGKAQAEFGKLPDWSSKIIYSGGCGLVSPRHAAKITINLKPGYYVLECYMKNADGIFHSSMGMSKELIVKDSTADAVYPPKNADVNINISSKEGIVYNGTIKKGETIFSVKFKDQKVYENFVGHDVNLVKLEGNYNLDTLEKWMNWMDPDGLINPAPEGCTFLGGINDSPAGTTAYFTADLEPGNYALIAELPDTPGKGMLKTFTVKD